MRRPVLASSSPRSIRSQSGSTLGRRAHRHRTVPACWQRSALPFAAAGKRVHGSRARQEPEHRVLRSFPPSGTQRDGSTTGAELRIVAAEACGAVSGQTGTDRVGWYACPRLTLFATEWSAARKNPMRAAALPLSAAISADVKARRILTSGRRKFPSGNFRSARDLEGAERVNPRKARLRPLHPRLLENEECPHHGAQA